MAITIDDFNKIWASTSPLTPYVFSESNYKEGWNFVGATPPSRQMWDFLQKNNDEKMQYLANNYLPLSGGTMTGTLTLSDGGTALSDATVGTVVSNSPLEDVSVPQSSATTITSVSLSAGTWVVTGHLYIQNANVTVNKSYIVGIDTSANTLGQSNEGSMGTVPPIVSNVSLQTVRIVKLSATTTVYMNVLATSPTVVNNNSSIRAVRIV